MNGERAVWIVGLLGAVAAAVGITVAVTSKASTTPSPSPSPAPPGPPPLPTPPPPPKPPQPPQPGNPQWVPAISIDPGKTYRISVPGDPVATALITQALVNTTMAGIYPPNTLLPADWPPSDTHDPSRWRAQFTNTTGATIPIPPGTGGVYIFVAQ